MAEENKRKPLPLSGSGEPGATNPDQAIGKSTKRFKIVSRLGEGGFGIVYLAEQKEPVKRQVALKVIKPGMDSKEVIGRFEAERQALAILDHPNIAQVFDGGTTKLGRPYFVMEYVKGLPITEYCDRKKLDTEQRLDLFLDVCRAIQHAHQKGIIHRDIKPSNILVSKQQDKVKLKVIDFGVAKAISQPLTERRLFTEQGQLLGTPEYMSPEQAELANQDIDIRSDIYSLGVLLYELLTGTLPFDPDTLRAAAFDEIIRIIRDEDPPRPSTRLLSLGEKATTLATNRRTNVRTLSRRLYKELEWIPLKAMRKEPDRRYQTASELANDVQNYLKGNPLIAGPESATYRARKFIRKRCGIVAAVAAIMLVLIVGIVASTIFASKAIDAEKEAIVAQTAEEKQRIIAEQAHEETKKALEDKTTALERAEEAEKAERDQRMITEQALADAREQARLAEEARKRANIALINEKIAQQEANRKTKTTQTVVEFINQDLFSSINPDQIKSNEATIQETLDTLSVMIEDKLNDEPLISASLQIMLANKYQSFGKYEEAELLYDKALEIRRRILGEEHTDTLSSMKNLGSLYREQARYNEAEVLLLKALGIKKRVHGEEQLSTLVIMNNLSSLYMEQDNYDKAEPLLIKTKDISMRVLGEKHKDTLITMNNLSYLYMEQARYNEAEPLLVKILEIKKSMLGEEHPDTLTSTNGLGDMYFMQGYYEQAEPLLVKSLEISKRVQGEEHPDTLIYMNNLGSLRREQARYNEAEPLLRKALDISKRMRGEEHPVTLTSMHNLGNLYRDQARYYEATLLLFKTLDIRKRLLDEEHPNIRESMNSLGLLYLDQGRYDQAEPLLVKSLEISKRVLGEEHPDTLTYMNNLGSLHRDQAHYNEAEPLLLKAFDISKRIRGEEHPVTLSYMNNLGGMYFMQTRYDDAEPLLLKALEISKRVLGEEHPDTLTYMNNVGSMYFRQARYDDAETLLLKALKIRKRVRGEEHPDTLKSMLCLADVYYLQKRNGEATGLLTKVLEIEQRVSGKEHIDIMKTDDNVATANGGQQIHKQVSDNTEELNLPEDTTTRLIAGELRIRGNTLITTSELMDHIPEVFNASDQPLSEAPAHSLYDLRIIRELIAKPGLDHQVSVRTIQGFTQYILSVYKKNDYFGIYVYVPEGTMIDGTKLVDKILKIGIIEATVSETRFKFFDAEKNEVEDNYPLRLAIEECTPIKFGKVGNQKALEQFLNLLNLIPDIHVDATLSPGSDPNTVALEYKVYQTNPNDHNESDPDPTGTEAQRSKITR